MLVMCVFDRIDSCGNVQKTGEGVECAQIILKLFKKKITDLFVSAHL